MGYPIPKGIGMVYGMGRKGLNPIPINRHGTNDGAGYPMGWDIRGTLAWDGISMKHPVADKIRILVIVLVIILAPLPYMLPLYSRESCFHICSDAMFPLHAPLLCSGTLLSCMFGSHVPTTCSPYMLGNPALMYVREPCSHYMLRSHTCSTCFYNILGSMLCFHGGCSASI